MLEVFGNTSVYRKAAIRARLVQAMHAVGKCAIKETLQQGWRTCYIFNCCAIIV